MQSPCDNNQDNPIKSVMSKLLKSDSQLHLRKEVQRLGNFNPRKTLDLYERKILSKLVTVNQNVIGRMSSFE